MHVAPQVLGNGRLPSRFLPLVGAVVVADEEPRLGRQREDRLDRVVERRSRAAGEVRPRGAEIGLHQRVVHESRVADDVGDRAERVAGRQHHAHLALPEFERFAVVQKAVEVTVRVERVRHVVKLAPERGDVLHLRADRGPNAGLLLEPCLRHQVVGVRVGVEQPDEVEALFPHEIQCRRRRGRTPSPHPQSRPSAFRGTRRRTRCFPYPVHRTR